MYGLLSQRRRKTAEVGGVLSIVINLVRSTVFSRECKAPELTIYVFCLESLTNRMNNTKEHCHDLQTNWATGSFNYIMFLDRHNVQCPPSHFLVSFRLQRKGDYNNSDVRYLYKCCQFML